MVMLETPYFVDGPPDPHGAPVTFFIIILLLPVASIIVTRFALALKTPI
jgi:hypothetical protein